MEAQLISLRTQRNALPRGSPERAQLDAQIQALIARIEQSGGTVTAGTKTGVVSGLNSPYLTANIVPLSGGAIAEFAPIVAEKLAQFGMALDVLEVLNILKSSGQSFPNWESAFNFVNTALRNSGMNALNYVTGSNPNPQLSAQQWSTGRLPNLSEQGLDPDTKQIGEQFEGWVIKEVVRYVKGKAVKERRWYKPIRLWTATERMAGSQQGRATSVEWSKMLRKAKAKSYKAGKRKGFQMAQGIGKQQFIDMG